MLPKYKKEHICKEDESLVTPIPKNIFVKSENKNVFNTKIEENHAYEQFFWTQNVVNNLKKSLDMIYVSETCGLMTPSLIYFVIRNLCLFCYRVKNQSSAFVYNYIYFAYCYVYYCNIDNILYHKCININFKNKSISQTCQSI